MLRNYWCNYVQLQYPNSRNFEAHFWAKAFDSVEIYAFGSSVNGFGDDSSDVDLVVSIPEAWDMELWNILERENFRDTNTRMQHECNTNATRIRTESDT